MREQTAVLVQHQEEWVLVVDDDEPERVWQSVDAAIAELQLEGWRIAAGPASFGHQRRDPYSVPRKPRLSATG